MNDNLQRVTTEADTREMEQAIVVYPGEDLETVVKGLIGPRSSVTYTILGVRPGEDGGWPIVRFRGTTYQLGALMGKINGNPVGRPRKQIDTREPATVAYDSMIELIVLARGRALTRDNLMDLWHEANDACFGPEAIIP